MVGREGTAPAAPRMRSRHLPMSPQPLVDARARRLHNFSPAINFGRNVLAELFRRAYPVKVLRLARDTPELTISLVTRHGDAENRAICVLKESIAGALAAAAAIVPADVVRP
jgi:hypothetical protein